MTQKECPYPNGCPRSGYQQPEKLLAENRYLATGVDELEAACNLAAQVIRQKDTGIAGLRKEMADLKAEALRKRFVSHQDEIFTFLSRPGVEPTNNFAERQIRPAVVMRKNTGGSRSRDGAERLAVMMSLIQTEKLQGKNPKDPILSLV